MIVGNENRLRGPRAAWVLLVLLVIGSGASRVTADSELINDEAGGIVSVTNQSGLLVTGLSGTLVLRLGKPGELRYESRVLQNRRDELPVGLWLEDSLLVLSSLHEDDPQRVLLEVTIPPGLDIEAEVGSSVIHASGLMSDLSVKGSDVELRGSGLVSDLEFEIEGGSVEIGASEGEIEVRGAGLEVKVSRSTGPVSLSLKGSAVELLELRGPVEADLKETSLVATACQAKLRAEMEGGGLELVGMKRGADLSLSDTTLAMAGVEGGVEIETNSEVRFREMKSNLTIRSYGGVVRGYGSAGAVQVTTDGAVVHLEQIQGPVTLEGQDLRVRLKELREKTIIRTSMSELSLSDIGAELEIENDFGSITLDKAVGPVKITSRDGDVRVSDLQGALVLSADGHEVAVAWSAVPAEGDSSLSNEGGNIFVALPANGRCRVEAQARYGRVDSDLPGIRVSDDGRSASGALGGANKPMIQIRSSAEVAIGRYEAKAGS